MRLDYQAGVIACLRTRQTLLAVLVVSLVNQRLHAEHNINIKRPNIIFIAVDDLRPELHCYGVNHVKSPNIDRLAADGIKFTQAYCQSAVCNPSRASLLTGMRPETTGVLDLNTNLRSVAPNVVTLPQYFKNNGYYCMAIGKIFHNIFPDTLSWNGPQMHVDGFPFDPDAGYLSDSALAFIEKRKQGYITAGTAKNRMDVFGKWYIKAFATECVDVPDNAYYDGAQTDAAIEKIDELSKTKKPFFFGIGYFRPHLPFNAPKKYWDLYDRDKIPLAPNDFLPYHSPIMAIDNLRELKGYEDFKNSKHPKDGTLSKADARLLKHGYLASVSYIDAQVGRLLDKLRQCNLLDNTIIVLWGDHGYKLGEHNSWSKFTNYGIDTRVPLIISTPSLKGKQLTCNRLVELVDVYPTLCALAGLKKPKNMEGISLAPLLKKPEQPWKKAVFSLYLREGIWVAPDGIPYIGYSVRNEKYLYVEWINWTNQKKAAIELYNLLEDPNENSNIATDNANEEIVKQMAAQLKAGWRNALPR